MVWLCVRALAGARRHSDGTAGATGRGKGGQALLLWELASAARGAIRAMAGCDAFRHQ